MGHIHVWLCLALAFAVFTVYAPVLHYGFINYDDPDYVTDNPQVNNGLSSSSVVWALTTAHAANWIPLTWISHMLDCQLFGPRAGMHHLSSVLIHVLSTVLLFIMLRAITGTCWRSFFVALFFALHPLHVESVAWVAERKDVLNGLFWVLTLWAYIAYTKNPSATRYVAVAIIFCLGLMSKPMIVTLPVVALLLDFWPLHRAASGVGGIRGLLLEKVPLFLLAIIAGLITYRVQLHGGAVASLDRIPLAFRLGNALASYGTYLFQLAWPHSLAPFYPYPTARTLVWKAAASAGVLSGIMLLAWKNRRRPYIMVGWLWYLLTLLPVIGLIQVGEQSHADRYTYIPSIGISIICAWGVAELFDHWRVGLYPRVLLGLFVAGALIVTTSTILGYWRDSTTLFQHASAVTDGNYVAFNNLGGALQEEGHLDQAVEEFRKALSARPNYPEAEISLSGALLALGRPEEAAVHIEKGLALNPNSPEAHINEATLLALSDESAQAAEQYRVALKLKPDEARAHDGLGTVLANSRRFPEAVQEFREAIRLRPEYEEAHYNLGMLLASAGNTQEAIEELSAAVRLQPADVAAHYNLGTALGNERRLDEAIEEFRAAVRLRPDYAKAHFGIAVALAQKGRCSEAVPEFGETLRLAPDFGVARDALNECSATRRSSR